MVRNQSTGTRGFNLYVKLFSLLVYLHWLIRDETVCVSWLILNRWSIRAEQNLLVRDIILRSTRYILSCHYTNNTRIHISFEKKKKKKKTIFFIDRKWNVYQIKFAYLYTHFVYPKDLIFSFCCKYSHGDCSYSWRYKPFVYLPSTFVYLPK